MRLELGSFPVSDVVLASQTRWKDSVLEIDVDELRSLVLGDPRIARADFELARPGQSIRIWPVRDVVEPRVKVDGPGTVYPGICGRPIEMVGQGRTHRLSGIGVVEVSTVDWHDAGGDPLNLFLDMSGPWAEALPHHSRLLNLCLVVEPQPELSTHAKNQAVHTATLAVSDRLAATTVGLTPPSIEVFELKEVDPSLPRVVFIWGLHSPEGKSGSIHTFCTSIYGSTRLTPPWIMHPNEILDGAVTGPYRTAFATSWCNANNPLMLELYRRHGVDLAFAGCIMYRTEWTEQHQKDLTAYQAAKVARFLNAQGAVITWDAGGNEFMEAIRTARACERTGIKTVFITSEGEASGGAPTILEPLAEVDAIVSTGFVNLNHLEPLPAMKRVIGDPEIWLRHWGGAKAPTATNTETCPYVDHYGFNSLRCVAY